MMRTFILGALAAAAVGFAAPAQAGIANPGLGSAASGTIEQAQYYYGPPRGYRSRGYYNHRRHWNRGYAFAPRCWTQRIVRWDGRVRYVRRCR